MAEKLVLDRPSLLLDIGNSSIKYAWYTFPEEIADLRIFRTSLDSIEALLEQAANCWLCSVVNEETSLFIAALCGKAKIPFHQTRTQAVQFDISNAYAQPQNMGADRWMVILAGAALRDRGEQTNFIVIDAGTAITCDFVVANKHLGGWIAPGLSMARTAVVSQTKRVFDQGQLLDTLTLGNDTPICVAQGALAQLSGMLLQACNIMQSYCSKYELYISGGDARVLISTLAKSENNSACVNINYVENLVLIGLAKIAHQNMAKND
ncbi:hypothetical protein BAE46_11935 [Glaciecola punicea]|jgi:type III pantothenate kinase|uniref:type III pantothenate kinase n=1 Tax=Glaciecola punicea TaxID=56804 RepID=UPI00058B1962|nr:type III pantothenate kinase [Glaciecola punicea]OFA30093.1 hypothetical protein BAE46_11935 [Glaciecola punicea]